MMYALWSNVLYHVFGDFPNAVLIDIIIKLIIWFYFKLFTVHFCVSDFYVTQDAYCLSELHNYHYYVHFKGRINCFSLPKLCCSLCDFDTIFTKFHEVLI